MAVNFRPDPARPLYLQINNEKLRKTAEQVALLLERFPELSVGNIQQKAAEYRDNAWYVGFRDHDIDDPLYLMNIKITPPTYNVEFRYPQYLPSEVFAKLPWQNTSWQRAASNHYNMNQIEKFIRQYLDILKGDYANGMIKSGGKSSAEFLMSSLLKKLFPQSEIIRNTRPDDMRSGKNRPLELDLFMPDLKLAIEIQGDQHFKEVYGCNLQLKANDLLKRELCAKKGIKLVWMNWDKLTKELFRISEEARISHLSHLFGTFIKGRHKFLWWKSMKEQIAE